MGKTGKIRYKSVCKRLLSLLLVIAIVVTGLNLENVIAKAAENIGTTKIYLIDNTKAKWLANDNAVLELVDNSNGHNCYEMTKLADFMWQITVPTSGTNITFNRLNPGKTTTWNSFWAGERGINNVYYIDGSEYGHWGYINVTEAAFNEGDIIYLNISSFTSWGVNGERLYINFSDKDISADSKYYINSLASNDGFNIKEVEKVTDTIYRYIVTAEDVGKTELRFWRGNDTELWNCTPVLEYEEYVKGYNCITITGWNESGELSYHDDYAHIAPRLAIALNVSEDGQMSLEWAKDENILTYDVYVRYDETGFIKLETVDEAEAIVKVVVDKELITSFVDYYVVGKTKVDSNTVTVMSLSDEIESNIITIVKDEEGNYYEDVIDTDEDKIPDGYEYLIGTDVKVADTDNDGFSDGYEAFTLCTNPVVFDKDADFDNDGLTNLEEVELGTNPYIVDSDFDGLSDSKDNEPMQTNVDDGKDIKYEIPVKIGMFDWVSKYYDEEGNKCELVYNYLNGQIKYMTNGKKEIYNIYNADNQLTAAIECVDEEIMVNTYSYTGENIETITHNGFQYRFQYDDDGNLTSATVGNLILLTNQYKEGKSISETYGNGYRNECAYDEVGNIIAKKYYEKKVSGSENREKQAFEWSYDEDGNLTEYKDLERNEIFTYMYNEEGILTSISSTLGFNISYTEEDDTYSVTYEYGGVSKKQTTITTVETDDSGNKQKTTTTNINSGGQFVTVAMGEEYSQKTVYVNDNELLTAKYTYLDEGVSKIEYQDGRMLEYTYDNIGNIIEVKENGIRKLSYEYDSFGQLIRENNRYADKTYTFDYDNAGNILVSREYAYTTGEFGEHLSSKKYEYNDNSWKDLLTGFNGQTITYDEIGNPLNYIDNMSFTWNGRQLAVVKCGENEVLYTYNCEGIRNSKTVNGVTITYHLDGTKIVSETTGDTTIWYIYDDNDMIIGFEYLEELYYFEKNAQGDVLRIYDEAGVVVSEYIYDAWGNIVDILGDEELAKINPFRYRGYYQDNETGFYYLQSRYYDAEIGRFLNADIILGMRNNLYTYCNNNPVNSVDYIGYFGTPIQWICAVVGGIAGWYFGDYIAKKLGLFDGKWYQWQTYAYWAVRGLVVVGGSIIGYVAGTKLLSMITTYVRNNPNLLNKLPAVAKWFLGLGGANQMANEMYVRYASHIFSADHIKNGIMKLGANKSVIFDKIFKVVTSNIKYAENGSNQIHTYINGYKVTVRFYFKDGELKSLDAFMGWASRVIGNLIK